MIDKLHDSAHCFRVSVSALIFADKQVLLAHRRDIDWWNLPGGGVDAGETLEEALYREVREETGLKIQVDQLVGVYSKPQKQEIVLTFRCSVLGGTLNAIEDDDIDRCGYFPVVSLPERTLPKHRERVMDALLEQERTILRAQRTSTREDQNLI
ncbi:MAG TPA: NUDIX hydrolase [Ktedonobacteraceae bacterium]|nr:NUDIX hydrolase [Ktedonobacteraceae bacterium]